MVNDSICARVACKTHRIASGMKSSDDVDDTMNRREMTDFRYFEDPSVDCTDGPIPFRKMHKLTRNCARFISK